MRLAIGKKDICSRRPENGHIRLTVEFRQRKGAGTETE